MERQFKLKMSTPYGECLKRKEERLLNNLENLEYRVCISSSRANKKLKNDIDKNDTLNEFYHKGVKFALNKVRKEINKILDEYYEEEELNYEN